MAHVVLVHTGPRFPGHINDCIEQLGRYGHTVSVIVSRDAAHLVRGPNQLHVAEDLEDSAYRTFSAKHTLDRATLGGFWERTSSRFFLIRSLAERHGYQNIVHIENDVLLFSDLTKEVRVLESSCDVGLVMDAHSRCVPSFLFFKNADSVGKLNDHILRNLSLTDMASLAAFFHANRDVAVNLPIIPESCDYFSTNQITYSNMFQRFGVVFDGAAIGQYLGGIDPIHGRPDSVGFVNETTVFNVSEFSFVWKDGEPYCCHGREYIKVCNLHVHSKNLRRFM